MSYFSQISEAIDSFSEAAFHSRHPNLTSRKKAMDFAAKSCPDRNIAHILGQSVGDLSKNPQYVHRAINLAHYALETLRFNRPDLK